MICKWCKLDLSEVEHDKRFEHKINESVKDIGKRLKKEMENGLTSNQID